MTIFRHEKVKKLPKWRLGLGMGSNLDNTQNKGCLSRIPSLDISYSALKVSMQWLLLIVVSSYT